MTIKEAIQLRSDVAKMKFTASQNYGFGKMVWPKIQQSRSDPDVGWMVEHIIEESQKLDDGVFCCIVGEVAKPIISGSGLNGKELGVAVIQALYDRLK